MSEFKKLFDPTGRQARSGWRAHPWRLAGWIFLALFFAYVTIATVRYLAWNEEDGLMRWFDDIASRPLGPFQFASPRWLLWLVPTWILCILITRFSVAGLKIWRRRFVLAVRLTVITLAILILAELQWVTYSNALSVMFVIDHSRSVPEKLQNQALAWVKKAVTTKEPDDRAGLMYFGGQAYPMTDLVKLFSVNERTQGDVEADQTDIARAIQRAGSMFPRGARRRIVVFTDGRETEGDVLDQIKQIQSENVRIDVVPLVHPMEGEIIAEKLEMPSVVKSDAPFDAELYVTAYQDCDAKVLVQLKTNEGHSEDLGSMTVHLQKGANRLEIPNLRNTYPGFYNYEATVIPLKPSDDTIAENNTVYGSTQIRGKSKVLILVGQTEVNGQWKPENVTPLTDALKAEGIFFDVRYAGDNIGAHMPRTIDDLQFFDCIVLANISKEDLGDEAMKAMKTAVNDLGVGLIMLGGKDSFGAGGYLHTPVEDVLPVSCETQDKKVLLNGALVIILHTCEFEQGNMWAVKIANVTVDTLSNGDYFGAMDYDWGSGAGWIWKLSQLTNKATVKAAIKKSDPGDMPDFDGIISQADQALAKIGSVGAKRIIVISDGDPTPPLPSTIQSLVSHQIALSFVGINPHGGTEISNMQAVSKLTKGNYYFCQDPEHLPRIFQHEAAIVRKKLIVESASGFQPERTDSLDPARLVEGFTSFPKVYGLNRTMRRDLADNASVLLQVKINDKETLPLLAYRRVGLGKTVAFTSDLSDYWGADWIAQNFHQKLWSQIVRKVSRAASTGTHSVRLTQKDGKCIVDVEVRDKNGDFVNYAKASGSVLDPDLNPIPVQFRQDGAGSYTTEFPMTKTGTYRVYTQVLSQEGTSSSLTGTSYSYSAEFRDLEVNEKKLEDMAKLGNGRELSLSISPEKAGVFDRTGMPKGEDVKDLKDDLLWLLIVLVLGDVFFRRVYLDFDSFAVWGLVQAAKVLPFLRGWAQMSLKRLDTLTPALQAAREHLDDQQKAAQAARRQAILEKIEKEGGSGDFNLDMDAHGQGGLGTISGPQMDTKVKKGGEKPAQSASEYTNRLLAAKRRAKKDLDDQSGGGTPR
ncbi:MAG: glutamine amidotransferase [Planctomycetota bacterium]